MVGIPRSTLVLGKHSGRHALERRYRELGYDLTELQLAEVYRQFTALADRKREILDEDLLALVHESFHDAPEEYQLSHLRVVCGSITPTAEVRMTGPWAGERSARGTGDGPIAAAFTAISDILGRQIEVLSLSLRSLTPGRDSVGQVFLQAKVDGKSLSGNGASTDIVEASARALIHALNKAHNADRLEASSLNAIYLWGV
jgi:2-isopropylmalate synthase